MGSELRGAFIGRGRLLGVLRYKTKSKHFFLPSGNDPDLNITGVLEELQQVKSENVDLRAQLNTVMSLLQQTISNLSKWLRESQPMVITQLNNWTIKKIQSLCPRPTVPGKT